MIGLGDLPNGSFESEAYGMIRPGESRLLMEATLSWLWLRRQGRPRRPLSESSSRSSVSRVWSPARARVSRRAAEAACRVPRAASPAARCGGPRGSDGEPCPPANRARAADDLLRILVTELGDLHVPARHPPAPGGEQGAGCRPREPDRAARAQRMEVTDSIEGGHRLRTARRPPACRRGFSHQRIDLPKRGVEGCLRFP